MWLTATFTDGSEADLKDKLSSGQIYTEGLESEGKSNTSPFSVVEMQK